MRRSMAVLAGVVSLVVVAAMAAGGKGSNEDVVRQYVELWNGADLATAGEILAPLVTRNGPTADTSARGLDNLTAYMAMVRETYLKFKLSIRDLDVDGDRVVLKWSIKATHSGKGAPQAEGKKVSTTGTSVFRVVGGKIVHERASWDYLGVYEQLGVEGPADRTTRNAAATRTMLEGIYERGDLDLAYEIIADDHVLHVPAGDETARGPHAVRQRAAMFRNAFPDLAVTVEEIIAEGDLVAARWTFYGTHGGEFLGVAPTNKKVKISGLSLARFRDGKAVESWGVWDTGELRRK